MAQDHFSQLDPSVSDTEHQDYPHDQRAGEHGNEHHHETDGEQDQSYHDDRDHRPAKQKKKLPVPLLLGGGFIVFIALFAGYKKIFSHSANPSSVPTAVASLPVDTGAGSGNGGMMAAQGSSTTGSVAALPAELPATQPVPASLTAADLYPASSTPATPFPSQASNLPATNLAPAATVGLPAAMQPQQGAPVAAVAQVPVNNASSAPVAASAPSDTSTIMSAAAATVPASAAQDAIVETRAEKITRLERELSELRGKHPAAPRVKHAARASAPAATTSADAASAGQSDNSANNDNTDQPVRHVSTRASHKGKRSRVIETQVGWHIKQVIPGQGWVEDENSGKQVVVSIGDSIGGAQVTKIDADAGKIYTTAGVIQ